MSESLRRRTETFIVRVWAEYLEQTPSVWRGEIEHAGSGEKTRFQQTVRKPADQTIQFIIGDPSIPKDNGGFLRLLSHVAFEDVGHVYGRYLLRV